MRRTIVNKKIKFENKKARFRSMLPDTLKRKALERRILTFRYEISAPRRYPTWGCKYVADPEITCDVLCSGYAG